MQTKEYRNIFKNEDTHFYYVGYHNIIISQLKQYLPKKRTELKILDAGCGTGGLTKKLSTLGETIGIDISDDAIRFAKKRGLKVKRGSISKITFPNNSFDIVVSADVLYHQWINDDKKVVQELLRVLKPGGILLIKLPAFDFLKSGHDLIVYTKKRYTKKEVLKLFNKLGVSVLKISYLGSFLLPLAICRMVYESLTRITRPHSSVGGVWQPINKLLITAFYIENFLIRYLYIPFGISILVIAIKK